MSRIRFGMDVVATLAAVIGCALLLQFNWAKLFPPKPSLPSAPVSLDGATLRGSPTAPVVLIEYSDYHCPYCGKVEREVLPTIDDEYIKSGRVQLVFRHHPLEAIHPGATRTAVAALCAGQQNRYWEMHAALFRNRDIRALTADGLMVEARAISLDIDRFSSASQVTSLLRSRATRRKR